MLEKYSQNDLILLCLFSYAGYKSSNVAEQAKRISLQPPTFSEGRYAKKITDKKIIIASGSNSLFGINSYLLSEKRIFFFKFI